MIIPQNLYNPSLSDQSISGYIKAYDNYINLISQIAYSEQGAVCGFTREQTLDALNTTFQINIALRIIHILDKYCDSEIALIIS